MVEFSRSAQQPFLQQGNYHRNDGEPMRILLRRLVRGSALEELRQNGIACVSEIQSIFCVITGAVRVITGAQPIIYLSDGQNLTRGLNFSMKPYAKRADEAAMINVNSVTIASSHDSDNIPVCDVHHVDPAIIISTGGYSANFFHTINDVMIPVFLSTKHFHSQIEFVVSDHKPLWMEKYNNFFKSLSAHDLIVGSSRVVPVQTKVHCFPGALVGVKYHHYLTIDPSKAPGDVNMMEFKNFLLQSFSLRHAHITEITGKKPIMVIICRRRTRTLRNEKEVANLARRLGFHVELAPPSRMKKTLKFAQLVNSCSVMVGVLGAGLTNMVFLPRDAVVVQIVPFALEWDAKTCYGKEPSSRFGLKYLEYPVNLEESTIYRQYSLDDPVIKDPESVKRQGYQVFKTIYLDGQNVTVGHISKFRNILSQAKKLVRTSS